MLVVPHNNACCGKGNVLEMTITKYAFLKKIETEYMLECLAWSSVVGTPGRVGKAENVK